MKIYKIYVYVCDYVDTYIHIMLLSGISTSKIPFIKYVYQMYKFINWYIENRL